jgi:uncharacterized integral membrane protein (TIGR00698 family)
LLPGLALVAIAVAASFAVARFVDVSPLVLGVVFGMIAANTGVLRPVLAPGVAFAAKRLLRAGIVLLGLRLSFDEVRDLGIAGLIAVVVVVVLSFAGIQVLARLLGLSSGFGLLVATGYSICGASAIAAMEPLSDADEEETAYAIGLVALCGSLSILVLPFLGNLMELSDVTFGTWAGAGVHDVGQVTATASAYSEAALAPATLVKLTRVMLLAPMVLGVGLVVRRRLASARTEPSSPGDEAADDPEAPSVTIVPLFVVGFLAAIALRATGWLSDDQLSTAKRFEQVFLTAGMFGLGAGVHIARLRRLGGRPLALGLVSWVFVACAALVAAVAVT